MLKSWVLPGPWVGYWVGGTVYVNHRPWHDLPRTSEWAGRTVYIVGSAPWLAIGARYLDAQAEHDILTAPWRGKPTGMCWTVEGGSATMCGGDAWALHQQPDDAAAELARLADVLRTEEALQPIARWHDSAAGLASALARRALPELRQLRPRWRALARASYHAGPQLALTGGSFSAVHLDRVAAYLGAMYSDLPVPGTWTAVQAGVSWRKLRSYQGFALLSVRVASDAALPPLPVRWVGGTAWPVGSFVGAWSIPWVREAEDAGQLEVIAVLDAQVCSVSPWLVPLADTLASVEDSRLRKMLYTRAYGIFGAAGRWTARAPGRGVTARRDASWAWRHTLTDPWGHQMGPTARPDLAAYIAGHNARAMLRAVRAVPAHAVHLAHVDALWVDSEHAGTVLAQGGWAVKGVGGLRVYGAGTYTHGTQARAQGVADVCDCETLGHLVAERTVKPMAGGDGGRVWTEGGPLRSNTASSSAASIAQGAQIRHVPTWLRSVWSAGNWRARGTEDVPLEHMALELPVDAAGLAERVEHQVKVMARAREVETVGVEETVKARAGRDEAEDQRLADKAV